ncbi:MAG: class I SAM-dependent methyltransferase [Acidimicrobiales bacterium]|nr:class I SAM-dependent methyltransferase [Acidimicrobiales bacterium]
MVDGLSTSDRAILDEARPLTMTSVERQIALIDAVQYTLDAGVPGAFAECGVWKGGSVLAIIRKLQANGVDDRDVYLYDTFEGMTEPGEADTSRFGESALALWNRARSEGRKPWQWFFDEESFRFDLVRDAVLGTGYPAERIHFVEGMVEDTIPAQVPDSLALLRLDTDWYESTRHEMEHLYPLLSDGGVLLIDDYGHWDGCRKAIDEYFSSPDRRLPLLQRVDYTARIAVKPAPDIRA